MRTLLSLLLILSVSATTVVASEHAPGRAEGLSIQHSDLGIQVKDGLVTMDVEGVEIAHVLKALSVQANIPISIHEGVRGKITVRMTDVPVEEAIRRLCEGTALVLNMSPKRRPTGSSRPAPMPGARLMARR